MEDPGKAGRAQKRPMDRSTTLDLPVEELYLWTLSYDPSDAELYEKASELLPKEEMDRFERLKFPNSRAERVISQAMLRVLLGNYCRKPPAEVSLERSSKGKPWLKDDPDINFNMSHSEGMTAIGLTRGQRIGVDLERVREMKDIEGLIRKNLQPGELDQLEQDPKERNKNFFRFWTFKEAYLKAVGEGMRLSPEKLEFRIRKARVELIAAPYPFSEEAPVLIEFAPTAEHVGTVCFEKEGTRLLKRTLERNEILNASDGKKDGAQKDL